MRSGVGLAPINVILLIPLNRFLLPSPFCHTATNANPKQILDAATSAVHLRYNFFETTIQIEDYTAQMESCQQCNVPEK